MLITEMVKPFPSTEQRCKIALYCAKWKHAIRFLIGLRFAEQSFQSCIK